MSYTDKMIWVFMMCWLQGTIDNDDNLWGVLWSLRRIESQKIIIMDK